MTKYFHNLTKLNLHPISLELHESLKNKRMNIIDLNLLNPELKTLLKDHGIVVSQAESFFSSPNFSQGIHVDDIYGGDYVKINWVYCDGESIMNWYEVTDIRAGIGTKPVKYTAENTPYLLWEPDEVKKVASDELKYPSIVQVGCPHHIINGDKPRLCIALIINHIRPVGSIYSNKDRLTMEEACNKLSFLE